MNKVNLGRFGEFIACKYLQQNNYKIIKQNFFYYGGEIDIIAFDNETKELVFFEIKTRSSKAYGFPSDAIDKNKVKRIRKGIEYYIHKNKINKLGIRADAIEIFKYNGKNYLNHIKQII